MVGGIVIPAAGEDPVEERDFAGLEDYQAAVVGWIEAVDVPSLGVTVYINEVGLLRQLPFNSRATFLWWFEVPEARQEAMLVGDAVLVGLPDRHGEITTYLRRPLAACRGCRVADRGPTTGRGTVASSRDRLPQLL